MPRWLRILLTFVLLGTAVNVIVAWSCAFLIVHRNFDPLLLGQQRTAEYSSQAEGSSAPERYLAYAFRGFGCDSINVRETSASQTANIEIHRAGWPLRCLWGERRVGHNSAIAPEVRFGISLNRQLQLDLGTMPGGTSLRPLKSKVLLSLMPMWPAIAVNSVVWGAGLWLLWAGCLASRSQIRRMRGMCSGCAYPIGASTACSECGRLVNPRRQRHPNTNAKLTA